MSVTVTAPPPGSGGAGEFSDRERWARHISRHGHWLAGAIRALEATTVPLSLVVWKAWTDSDCPVPPRWGGLSPHERKTLANLLRSLPSAPAFGGSSAEWAEYQAKLTDPSRGEVAVFAGRCDEALASDPEYADCRRASRTAATIAKDDRDVRAWTEHVLGSKRTISAAACRRVAALLESRSSEFAIESLMTLGTDGPSLDPDVISGASNGAIVAVAATFRSAADEREENMIAAAMTSGSETASGPISLTDFDRRVRERVESRERERAETREAADASVPGVDGGSFIFDGAVDIEARWGRGSEVLWAAGESLLIAAPTGVGKTTLTGQLIRGLIGLQDELLGYPIRAVERKVLYLAMDRPRQIRRSLRRQFSESERATLAERLVVRPGPLPTDLAADPGQLLRLAERYGADVVVVDSLKDAAVKLTDDETGGNVNRAVQFCNAAGVDVLVLHHQRKGDGTKKPNTLADVYGSTWVTAGAGSVIVLWGEAGGELVDLFHLKQPADPVGPLRLEHDHLNGITRVAGKFDVMTFLRDRGAGGATVAEVAAAQHGAVVKVGGAEWKRTERRLKRAVADGHARHETRSRVGSGEHSAGRYLAADVA